MVNKSQTRFVTAQQWERIEQWSRRKPVFALMGEFSAGKSTLMNFLLRQQALPTQVTATQLPPVWFSWGSQSAYVKRHDGSRENITLDQLEEIGVNDAQFIRIYLESDILEAVDLIDTPGISDPKIDSDVWRRAVGQANGVLWCTHSTQAWRETERATWVSLPERLQNNSLLLVTRADALNTKDRQKVLRRVNREAGHLFNRSILFSARDAITARDKTGDAELWSRSGGGKMVDSFLEITEQIMDARAEQLARYKQDESASCGAKVMPVRPPRQTAATDESREDSAPLQLLNPLDPQDAARGADDDVVTSFPVRPARVERRTEEAEERSRIDADEAERLRAEMVPETPAETEDDDLRAFFRDTASEPLELSALAQPDQHTDGAAAEDPFEAQPDADDTQVEDPDAMIASLSDTLAATPEKPAFEDTQDSPDIEVSVSSITSLLAEQTDAGDDEYEPEPESNALTRPQVVVVADAEADRSSQPETTALEDLLDVPSDRPLSAAAMWREISASEDLPDDATALAAVFQAFLEEFDQIAREHHDRGARQSPQAIPGTKANGSAEWLVL